MRFVSFLPSGTSATPFQADDRGIHRPDQGGIQLSSGPVQQVLNIQQNTQTDINVKDLWVTMISAIDI